MVFICSILSLMDSRQKQAGTFVRSRPFNNTIVVRSRLSPDEEGVVEPHHSVAKLQREYYKKHIHYKTPDSLFNT